MGCCMDTATHFGRVFTDTAQNRAFALGFGFLAPNPSLPALICQCDACNCRHFERDTPPPTSTTHHCCLARQTWNQAILAWFQVFGPPPPPPACVFKCNLRGHQQFERDTPPPPPTTHRCRLTWQAWNQATVAWFRGFGLPCFAFANAWPPPAIACRRHHQWQ